MSSAANDLSIVYNTFYRRQYAQAEALLEPYLAGARPSGEVLMLKARVCAQLWNTHAAEAFFERAIAISPVNAPWLIFYADLLLEQGRFAEAERALMRAIINHADPLAIYARMVLPLVYQGHFEPASQILEFVRQAHAKKPIYDLPFDAWRKYIRYLEAGHRAFVLCEGKLELFFPIMGLGAFEDSETLTKSAREHELSNRLIDLVSVGDVCVEIGSGAGFYTVFTSVVCAASVIALEWRPVAVEGIQKAAANNGAFIDTQYLGRVVGGDGKVRIRDYSKAPLDSAVRFDVQGELVLEPLDALNLPRADVIVNHTRGMVEAFLTGAQETLKRFRPKLLLRVEVLALERTHALLASYGYSFSKGDSVRDGESLYCVYLPR